MTIIRREQCFPDEIRKNHRSSGCSIGTASTESTEDMPSVDGSLAGIIATPSRRKASLTMKLSSTSGTKKSGGVSTVGLSHDDENHDSFQRTEEDGEWWGHESPSNMTPTKTEEGTKEKKHRKKKRISVQKVKVSDFGNLSAHSLEKLRVKARGSLDEKAMEDALHIFKESEKGHQNRVSKNEIIRSKSRTRGGGMGEEQTSERHGRSRSVARSRESSISDRSTGQHLSNHTTGPNSVRGRREDVVPPEADKHRRSRSIGCANHLDDRSTNRSNSVSRQREKDQGDRRVPVLPIRIEPGRNQRSKSLSRASHKPRKSEDEQVVPRKKELAAISSPRLDDSNFIGEGRKRSKSMGRAATSQPKSVSTPCSRSDRGRSGNRDGRKDESDRPRTQKTSTDTSSPHQQRHRSKSIGRNASSKSDGNGVAQIPKLWDQSRQRSKSIGPRRRCNDNDEDEFMQMAERSFSRGIESDRSNFFNEDKCSLEKVERVYKRGPLPSQDLARCTIGKNRDGMFETSPIPLSKAAKSIPWDSFLQQAEASRSKGTPKSHCLRTSP